jgi:hypothetical protein
MVLALSACTAGSTAIQSSAVGRFGELPDGALSRGDISGIHAEICQQHLFARTSIERRLPSGYRLQMLSERAETSKLEASVLQQHPELATYGLGNLCFVLMDTFAVNGQSVRVAEPVAMAVWWGLAVPTGSGPRDDRLRGDVSQVQLASWYSRSGVDRALIAAIDPMADFVDVQVSAIGAGHWRVLLGLANGKVEGDIHGRGDRQFQEPSPEPSYMTVLFSGPQFDYFTVYTYFGHYIESTTSDWRSSGTAEVALAAARTGPEFGLSTVIQDGWQARSGLYRSAR